MYPGLYALKIPGVLNNQNLAVGVVVINGTANFCVIEDDLVALNTSSTQITVNFNPA